ncbi:MAG: AI-2E family transporter [Acetobacteraceae bacterium]|nr:AI-2E family transporter [Acetobacteraceae bacterium]MBV8521619.1 AI-2E family transporter [Acetobacteraceae bacterium]
MRKNPTTIYRVPTEPGPPPPETSKRFARGILGLALFGAGIWTLHEFLPALIWASILAIATWPSYQKACKRWPWDTHHVLVPAIFTAGVALMFILPLAFVAAQLAQEAHAVFGWVERIREAGVPAPDWLAHLPVGSQQLTAWWNRNLASPTAASEFLGRMNRAELMTYTREIGHQVLHRIVLFGFTIITLFFIYRDGSSLKQQLLAASRRAFGPGGESIARQMIDSVHGTVDGLVLVGLGVGLVLGVAYAIAGVPHATLLGAVTAGAAMIPFGAPIVFGFAAFLLLVQQSVIAAIAVFAWGVIVTFVADHFVRPVLIGGATQLPFVWVLLGILGGVESWGFLGLFLGPAIMAALIFLWREYTGHAEWPAQEEASGVAAPALADSAPVQKVSHSSPY